MPLALARMKRIWITKHVGKKQLGRERNNQTPYITVKKVVAVLFLLGNNRGIFWNDFLLRKGKTMELTT